MWPTVGVSADPKVLSHFFFALKQSKANKCQCAKRLKTVKKLLLKFFVKEFWKKLLKKGHVLAEKAGARTNFSYVPGHLGEF